MASKIRPLHELMIVKPFAVEKKTAGGIVIPEASGNDKPVKAEVIAVGNGRLLSNGTVRPLEVKVGDTVLYDPNAGFKIKYEEEEVLFLREDEIMAIYKG